MRQIERVPRHILALALVLFSTSVVAAEKPIAILAKPGGTFAQREVDRATCQHIVNKSPGADMPAINRTGGNITGAPTLAGAAGASIAMLLFELIDSGRAQSKGQTFCLENLGYSPVPLTDAEKEDYLRQPMERRQAWEEKFLGSDLTARIVAVRSAIVPPLPAYRDEPNTIGGLRFFVGDFTASDKPVSKGGVIITGKVERWRTAILIADFATENGPVTVAGKAGAVFHQVDYRPQRDPLLRDQGATWCGPFEQTSAGGTPAPSVYCFSTHREGYGAYHPTGFTWLAGPLDQGFVLPSFTKPILLDERPTDDLGQLDFVIKVDSVTPGAVALSGIVTHNGQHVRIWSRRLKAGRDGKIVIPMWARRAVLTPDPTAGTVAAVLDSRGDGKSMRDAW